MPDDLAELRLLRLARDRMDREFAQPLTVADLARTAAMSPAHFSRRFLVAYSETPYAYLMTRRIERAKALLVATELSVTDISLAVGCSSLGTFSARFTELVGCSPTRYRWVTLSNQAQPSVNIVLSQPEPGRSEEDGKVLAALVAKGTFMPVHLRADDLDALFVRLADMPGVSIVQEPTDQFWGVRDGALRDPAGNLIRIEQA